MDTNTAHRILDVQERLLLDREYTDLLLEYREQSQKFCNLLSELDSKQQAVINEFLSVCVAMHLQILKIACTDDDSTAKPPSDEGGGTA